MFAKVAEERLLSRGTHPRAPGPGDHGPRPGKPKRERFPHNLQTRGVHESMSVTCKAR
jgi:hypothetical protein